jgi:hypothetical protein
MSKRLSARFAAVLAVILVVGLANIALGAKGDPLIIGNITQSAGTSNTALTTRSSGNAFKMQNNGTGSGLRGVATGGGNGVSVTATHRNGNGVFAENTASTPGNGLGALVLGNQQPGLYAQTLNGDAAGVIGDDFSGSTDGTGTVGFTDFGTGVFGLALNDPDDEGIGPGNGGYFVNESSDDYALFAEGCADPGIPCPGPALAAQLVGNVLIDGDLEITGTCTGCTAASMAMNGTDSIIRQGDAVALVGAKTVRGGLLLLVAPAREGQQLIGVADRAMLPHTILKRSLGSASRGRKPPLKVSKQTVYVPAGRAIQPGQLMRVVTHGVFAFGSASSSAGAIRPGDPLSLGRISGRLVRQRPIDYAGQTFYAPGASIGYALGTLGKGNGLIAIFVNPH